MEKSARRLWLIDAGYMYNAQMSISGRYRVNYMSLKQELERDGPIWRSYYLAAAPNPGIDGESFHVMLRKSPPEGPGIITKVYGLKEVTVNNVYCQDCEEKIVCPNNENHNLGITKQRGVDVGLAMLALNLADRYDTLILSSGDGDLLEVVEYLWNMGKNFQMAVFREGVSTDLQCRAEKIYWISGELAEKVRMGD